MPQNRIAVLMSCHNRADKTSKSLGLLFKQQGIADQYTIKVFLTDDGSTDGTADIVRENFSEVNILQGDGKLYWNKGMYYAWSEAEKEDFDFYLWLNDDTFLYAEALFELLEGAKVTNRKSIICGATCSAVTGTLTYGGILKKKGLIKPNGQLQPCDYFTGNFVLISREVYKIVGKLDYSFTHTIGDFDYGLRAGKLCVPSYVAGFYIGTCEKHETVADWCSPALSLSKRIKAFKTPLGVNPGQYFRFDVRYNGFLVAVFHFITIHIRLFFPSLWKHKY